MASMIRSISRDNSAFKASWHYLEGGSKPSEDAWRSAHLKNRSKAFPNKTLEAALIRLFSWQINTSGVERAFAKGLHAARKRGDVGELAQVRCFDRVCSNCMDESLWPTSK